eukprot:TRINITY_DN1064_c0_g1_i2.p1 TRINITY_DN1064_c0_g1~~TRINITY_DN1064_c0_g1_i2.p1  ORF type:complete len:234 (-),score=31.45 TRINITY_DN1064_c0_g1_i2:426-1127(-)
MIAGCKFFNWDSMTTNSSRPLRSKDLRMSVDFLTSHDVQKFGEPVFPVPVMYMTATSFSSFPKYPFLKHNVDMGSPRRSSPHTSMPSMGGTTTTTFSDESPTMGIVKEISDTAIKMVCIRDSMHLTYDLHYVHTHCCPMHVCVCVCVYSLFLIGRLLKTVWTAAMKLAPAVNMPHTSRSFSRNATLKSNTNTLHNQNSQGNSVFHGVFDSAMHGRNCSADAQESTLVSSLVTL